MLFQHPPQKKHSPAELVLGTYAVFFGSGIQTEKTLHLMRDEKNLATRAQPRPFPALDMDTVDVTFSHFSARSLLSPFFHR
jgi:hypothetical protein